MNKFYGRINLNKPRISPYPNYTRSYPRSHYKGKSFYKKLLSQIIVCILLVLLAILLKTINIPLTNRATEIIKTSLAENMDFKGSLNKIVRYAREVPKLPERAVEVFMSGDQSTDKNSSFIPPVQGVIVSNYGQYHDAALNINTFQRGIDIKPSQTQDILAVEAGEIVEIGQSAALGKYIQIRHANNVVSLYGNCSEVIALRGNKVEKGEKIGVIRATDREEEDYLHFELWIDGDVVDPTQYIEFDRVTL